MVLQMSQPAKKEKRRIVPMLVVDEKKSSSPVKAAAAPPLHPRRKHMICAPHISTTIFSKRLVDISLLILSPHSLAHRSAIC